MATQTLSQILSGHGQTFMQDVADSFAPSFEDTAVFAAAGSVQTAAAPPPPFEAPIPTAGDGGGLAPPIAHPVLRSLASDQADAYAEEVRVLRRRVATLEAALKAAHAQVSQTVCEHAPVMSVDVVPNTVMPMAVSEFGVVEAPAVVQITAEAAARQLATSPESSSLGDSHAVTGADVAVECAHEIMSNPTSEFADVWVDEEDTFEEKFAARAFFEHTQEDQPSRRWFLGSN